MVVKEGWSHITSIIILFVQKMLQKWTKDLYQSFYAITYCCKYFVILLRSNLRMQASGRSILLQGFGWYPAAHWSHLGPVVKC